VDSAALQHSGSFAAPWVWTPAVDDDVLSKLEVRETSEGIVRTQRANRESWWAHAARNRGFISEAIAACRGREVAIVLGAGQVFDLPIGALVQAFRRLILVDIDHVALEEAAASVSDASARARVEIVAMDVTGINQRLIHGIDEQLDGAAIAPEAESGLARLATSYRLTGAPRLVPDGGRADLLISSCMLSQLAWSQQRYARLAYWRRFGTLPSSEAWGLAWRSFERGVQQDHVDALTALADVAVLTSDVVMHTTALDAAGTARRMGAPQLPLHASSLGERVRPPALVEARAGWTWELRRPDSRRGALGLSCDVEALRLRRG
jgi:hypothetical protein